MMALSRLAALAILLASVAACSDDGNGSTTTSVATTEATTSAPTSAPTTAAETTVPVTEPPGTTEAAITTTSAGDGPTATVSGGQEHRTAADGERVHCDNGGEVYVNHNQVTITGNCNDVDVLASGASLVVESTGDLDVEGNDNTVDVSTVRDVDVAGNGNVITLGDVTEIDIEGNGNTVTFASGNPSIDDEGSGNSVTQA